MEALAREALSNAAWAAGLALLATAAGLACRRRPALIHTLWLLVLLKLATPSLVHRTVELEAEPPRVAPTVAPSPAEPPQAVALPDPPPEAPAEPARAPLAEARPAPVEPRAWSWERLAIAGWLGGAAIWWSAVIAQVARSRALLRDARPAPGALVERSERLARRLGLRRGPGVALVDAPIPPMLWAIAGPPRLLLPEALWARLDERQQDAILAHELAHLRRRDHWVRRLEAVVLGLYWWNPVAWWARRRVEAAEEECCDAWVRWALPDSLDAYAEALVETAVFLSGPRPRWSPGTTASRPIPPLRRRLMMILADAATLRTTRPGPRAALILGILALPFLPAPSPAEPPEPAARAPEVPPTPAKPEQTQAPVIPPLGPAEPGIEAKPSSLADKAGDLPIVEVARPIVREVEDFEEFTGRIEAAQTIEIRSRIGGTLERANRLDGESVEKGDILFEIDPGVAKAEFDRAVAEVGRFEARLTRTESDHKRADNLLARNAIGQDEYNRITADHAETLAALHGAEASREIAKLKLESAKIRAPIGGRLSRPRLPEGSLVAAETTVLATIDSREPMCVTFAIDERSALKLNRSRRADRPGAPLKVRVGLSDEEGFPHSGELETTGTRFDQVSGTLQCRAKVSDPDGLLLPGLFARVRLIFARPIQAMLVPEAAVMTEQGRKLLCLANDRDVVELRSVRVGSLYDGLRAIREGLKAEDRVLLAPKINQYLIPKVQPKLVEMPIGQATAPR